MGSVEPTWNQACGRTRAALLGCVAAVALLLSAAPSKAGAPIRFTEGPFTYDDEYPPGWLCDSAVRVNGTVTVEQIWRVSSFPPPQGEEWTSLSHFRGTETWTNIDAGVSTTDSFRYTIWHDWIGFELAETRQSGLSTNVPRTRLHEAGRTIWDGEDLFTPVDVRGRWIQHPDFSDWLDARCDTISAG